MTMIEQVARALATHHYTERFGHFHAAGRVIIKNHTEANWRSFEQQARAAINAMSEPTEAMLRESYSLDHDLRDTATFKMHWQIMIATALMETGK